MPISAERLKIAGSDQARSRKEPITVTFEDGTVTLLLGRAGAGKTTLLEALAGLHPLEEGAVRYDGELLWHGRKPNPIALRRFGLVFQQPERQLFARTVQMEFDFSLRYLRLPAAERNARMEEAMREMDLTAIHATQSPHTLSGGQKRRLALACTFATSPDWLLMDEPTAGLDPESVVRLTDYIRAHKGRGAGGAIIATHDAETLLPIADRVLFVKDRSIVADLRPEELADHPDLWELAETGRPPRIALLSGLRQLGIPAPGIPPAPEELASQLLAHMQDPQLYSKQTEGCGQTDLKTDVEGVPEPASRSAKGEPGAAAIDPHTLYDPRSKWVFYMLLSTGILLQRDWAGLAAAAVLTMAFVFASGISYRSLYPFLLPYGIFVAISAVVSGVEWGKPAEGFASPGEIGLFEIAVLSWPKTSSTLFSLLQIVPVMAAGIWFALTTGTSRMKRALDQTLAPLKRLKLPVEAFSLGASLLLRFIPVLLEEAGRFSRIARARGKKPVKSSVTIPVRDLQVMIAPMILSVIQLASDMAFALETRGYKDFGGSVRRAPLRLHPRDYRLMAAGLLLMLALAALNFIF